jgi:hypothetical protein
VPHLIELQLAVQSATDKTMVAGQKYANKLNISQKAAHFACFIVSRSRNSVVSSKA